MHLLNSFISLQFMIGFAFGDLLNPQAVNIFVSCSSNCNPTYLELPLLLTVTCHECPDAVNFYWSVSPIMGYFDFAQDTTISDRGRKLNINPNVFKPNDEISFMAITWGQAGETTILFKEKPPTYFIKCKVNCPFIDRNQDSSFTVVCDPHCKNANVNWTLVPLPLNFNWSLVEYQNDNLTIIFKAKSLEPKMQYNLFLEANGFKQNLTISTTLADSHLYVYCTDNCGEYVEVEREFTIISKCIECKEGGTITWEIEPKIENYYVDGHRGSHLTIPGNTFLGGISGNITAFLEGAGRDTISFTTEGACSMYPLFGYPGYTNFTIDCNYLDSIIVNVFQKVLAENETDPGVLFYHGNVKELRKHNLWLLPGNLAYVHVVISEFDHNFILRPNVTEFLNDQLVELETVIIYRYFGQNKSEGSFVHALWSKNWNKIIQIAAIIIYQLQYIADPKFVSHYQFHILTEIEENAELMEYEQVISIMLMIARNLTDARSAHVLAEAIKEALAKLDSDIPYSKTKRVACEILDSYSYIGNLSTTVDPKLSVPTYVDEYIFDYHDVYYLRAKNLFHLKWVNHYVLQGIESLARFGFEYEQLHLACRPGGIVSYTMKIGKQKVIRADNISSYIELPSEWIDKEESNSHVQLAVIRPNIFWWQNIGKKILSEIVMVNIFVNQKRAFFFDSAIDIFIESNSTVGSTIIGNLSDEIAVTYKILGARSTTLFLEFIHLGTDYFTYFSSTYPYTRQAKHHGQRVVRTNFTTIVMKYDYIYLVVHKYLPDISPFEIGIKLLDCVTYDETSRQWINRYCRLGAFSTPTHTHCQCNHLSLFAVSHSGLAFVEAQLHDKIAINVQPQPSELVIVMVIIAVGFYCVIMIRANHQDKVVEVRSVISKPVDTMPGDEHLYFMYVETGDGSDAGTTATVILQIFGEKHSRKHIISGPNRLEKDGENWYVIFCPENLGNIHAIRLFHDVTGRYPSWFCRKVIIKHVISHKTYKFDVSNWFSLVRGDGRIDRVIHVQDKKKKSKFKETFRKEYRFESQISGLCTRPVISTYTHKERFTVYFMYGLTSMASVLLVYGIVERKGWETKQSLYFGLPEWIMLLGSILVSAPVALFISILFKKAKPFVY